MIIIKFLSWDVKIKVTTGQLSNKRFQTLNQVPHSLLVSCLMVRPDLNVIHCSTHSDYITSTKSLKLINLLEKKKNIKEFL